jgi:hypothetical protein
MPNTYREIAMPEISRFLGIIIAMFYNEHNPPHFHARYGEYRIEIAIQTLSVLAGKLPPRAMGLVMEWASRHQDELMADWELARQSAELKRIAPLEWIMFLIDVTDVHALPNRQLELTFEDGVHGTVEMDQILRNYSGVFEPLLEAEYFQQVKVDHELGTIVWPNGADVCPDVLYAYTTGKYKVVDGEILPNWIMRMNPLLQVKCGKPAA